MTPPILDRIRNALGGFMRPPTETGSPSDDQAQPILREMLSRSGEAGFVPSQYLDAVAPNTDTILEREGGADLKLYDALLDDDVAMSALQQRRLAIVARDWEVAPGDDKDPRSVKAADDFRAMLKALGWDRVTGLMHYALWYGYSVSEGIYEIREHDGRQIVWLKDIVVPDRRYFGFTVEGELRMTASYGLLGQEKLPDNKFWSLRTGGTHDFAFYGLGLAHWCYWPIFFKRAAMKFWAVFLEKYGTPTALGAFPQGATQEDKDNLLGALVALGQDSAVTVSEAMYDKVKFMEATRSGSAASSYREFNVEQNEAIMRVVLGQPGTMKGVSSGLNSNQAGEHAEVKREIVKADSDLISEGIGGTFASWVTRWNHGPDVAPPTVYRVLDDPEDLNTTAERDSKLDAIGIQRTEESIEETYGSGYERKPEPEPPVVVPGVPGSPGLPVAANDDEAAKAKAKLARRAAEFGVNDRAPLYVYRQLTNAGDLLTHMRKQGFKAMCPADSLHTTVLYSKAPVDWFELDDRWGGFGDGKLTVPAGGARKVERLGDEGAVVLRFSSSELRYRHDSMVERGASHDYDEYLPHITFTYDPGEVDLDKVEPYTGELRFGPEMFEPIREKGFDPEELGFAASELDAIDRLVDSMLEDGNPIFEAMASELRDSLQGVTTVEGARIAMLEAWERFPVEKLAQFVALPMLATRTAARAGEEDAVEA